MRYVIRDFSMSMIGIWDKDLNDFVRNPSGRKKLFYKEASAKKAAASLNAAKKENTK